MFERVLEIRPELREQVAQSVQLYVCIDAIIPPIKGGNYHHRIHLRDICVELGQLIMFQRYGIDHGLNQEAFEWTKWAEKQENLLPVDPHEFFDKRPVIVTVLDLNSDIGDISVEEIS
jgi:hypothetical protein